MIGRPVASLTFICSGCWNWARGSLMGTSTVLASVQFSTWRLSARETKLMQMVRSSKAIWSQQICISTQSRLKPNSNSISMLRVLKRWLHLDPSLLEWMSASRPCRRVKSKFKPPLNLVSSHTLLCWGLNSQSFPVVGMVINLIVGVYIPIVRIPYKGEMTIPNIGSLDPGTWT